MSTSHAVFITLLMHISSYSIQYLTQLNGGRLCFVEPVQTVVWYTEINARDNEQSWILDTCQLYFHSVNSVTKRDGISNILSHFKYDFFFLYQIQYWRNNFM